MKHVAPDLRTPCDVLDLAALGVHLFGPLALLQFDQLGLEHLHRDCLVLGLGSLVLTLDDYPRGFVGDPDGRVGLVDVLATGARGSVGIYPYVGILDLDLDRLIDHRSYIELGE